MNNYVGKKAYVTIALLIVNIIVFLWMTFTGDTQDIDYLKAHGAMDVLAVVNDGEWWRIFTHMFVHSGFRHIVSNMIMLAAVGFSIEQDLGSFKFAICYFVGGIGATIASGWYDIYTNNYPVGVGASGAIMAIFGVMVVMTIKNRKNFDRGIGIRMAIVLAIMIFGNMEEGVDWMAHLGGAITGVILGIILYRPKYKKIVAAVILALGLSTILLAMPQTSKADTLPSATTSEYVKLEGIQISGKVSDAKGIYGGTRVVGSIEPHIEGRKVEKFGLIFALTDRVSEDEIVADSKSKYVYKSETTDAGILDEKIENSETAIRYAQTMLFGVNSKDFFDAQYSVRSYAYLEDGTYLYSGIETYSVLDIADKLYQESLMSSYDGHCFLYDNILKIVDPDYMEVEYKVPETSSGEIKKYAYYSTLEKAFDDADSNTTANADATEDSAEAKINIEDITKEIVLMKDCETDSKITFNNNIKLDLDGNKLTMNGDYGFLYSGIFSITNGEVNFPDSYIGIKHDEELSAGGDQFLATKVKFDFTSSKEKANFCTLKHITAVFDKCDVKTTNKELIPGIYIGFGTATIRNTKLDSKSTSDNMALGVCLEDATAHFTNDTIKATGDHSGRAIDTKGKCEVDIISGNYYVNPAYAGSGGDSYGAALRICEDSKCVINEIGAATEMKGGNAAIQSMYGSDLIINGGTFKSPNHGGLYACNGSKGTLKINRGKFMTNVAEYDEDVVSNIVPYAGAYFGTNEPTSDKWSVDINYAEFVGGQCGLVQKSNSGYVPPTINIKNTLLSGANYDLKNQNNEIVATNGAYINIAEGTILKHNRYQDEYYDAHGIKYIIDKRQ